MIGEEPCTKRSYESMDEARSVLATILATSKKDKKPRRAYQCDSCGKFHLTSITKDKQKQVAFSKSKEGQQQQRVIETAVAWARKKGWDIETD